MVVVVVVVVPVLAVVVAVVAVVGAAVVGASGDIGCHSTLVEVCLRTHSDS